MKLLTFIVYCLASAVSAPSIFTNFRPSFGDCTVLLLSAWVLLRGSVFCNWACIESSLAGSEFMAFAFSNYCLSASPRCAPLDSETARWILSKRDMKPSYYFESAPSCIACRTSLLLPLANLRLSSFMFSGWLSSSGPLCMVFVMCVSYFLSIVWSYGI